MGYTSYDVGAAIAEDRQVNREKYSELKLQANFLKVSPDYQTSQPSEGTFGVFTNTRELVTTELAPTTQSGGSFYIVRHSDWTSQATVNYSLRVTANGRNLTIPQLDGSLSLIGRDSKIHVVDYDVGGISLHYSSAEIFTWKKLSSKTVLIIYGDIGETHELAVSSELGLPSNLEGDGVRSAQQSGSIVMQWDVQASRRVVHFGTALEVHLLWRNDAYQYWVLDLPRPDPIGNFVSASRINDTDASVIVKAGYLLRNATVSDDSLYLWGDVNQTTTIEVFAAPLTCDGKLYFNGEQVKGLQNIGGRLTGVVEYSEPEITLPDFSSTKWKYIDSLPEIQDDYDDQLWPILNKTVTNNTRALTTPTSLYASDYGFHSGSLIYRGHFTATGNETNLYLNISGRNAFAHSVWLNSTYLGSWTGDPNIAAYSQNFTFETSLEPGAAYVITVLIDHMGLSQAFAVGAETTKDPRGILDYALSGNSAPQAGIVWKMTGNAGGENYADLSRGPRNEGAMLAERLGYHLPGAPTEGWDARSPIADGVEGFGVGFYATTFDLDVPGGYDVPMSFVFTNASSEATSSTEVSAYRVQLFVNGWQFGEYGKMTPLSIQGDRCLFILSVNNIGPQISYPIPEGILNHNGENYLALTLWSLEPNGAKLAGLSLEAGSVVQSGYTKPALVEGETYNERSVY